MKRIGKFFYAIALVSALITCFAVSGVAQSSVSVEASISESTIYTGERVRLSISISGDFNDISRPELPQFSGFRLLSNSPSTSRNYRYVNGKSSTTYSYSYYLVAQSKGSYSVPPVSVTIDGKKYQTKPINIDIVDRNQSAKSNNSNQPNVFLRLEISDTKPVTGQQIISNVVLYFKDGLEINSYQPIPGWKAEGFWKEELKNTSRPKATSTLINGVRYRKARLLQFALFPTKQGALKISPYKIAVSVRSNQRRNDPFSSFFGGYGSNQRQVQLETDPVAVTVQPLPSVDKGDYMGAVGRYKFSRSISTKNAKVGESVEITTRVKGTGNVPLITKPEYDLPKGLEVYEPQESTSIDRKNHRISGTKTFTDVIIARTPGDYSIPSKKVAYFDPSKKTYVHKTLSALHFSASENPAAVASGSTSGSFPVRPITGLASWITPTAVTLVSYWWFWLGIILPAIFLGVAYWQKSHMQKMNTNHAYARSRRASEKAFQRLEDAISLSKNGDIKQAYNMMQKALTGFISDKLTLPEAGLSNEEYVHALKEHGVDENLVKNVRMLLDKCASISYAPTTSHEYLKSHVGLAQSTLEKLKKVL